MLDGLNVEKLWSSSGKQIAFLLNGQIPKLLITFSLLNPLNHAFAKSSQKSKRDTVLPGLATCTELVTYIPPRYF